MKRFFRLPALGLAFTLLFSTAAQALTPDQCRDLLQQYYIDDIPQTVLDQETIQQMLEALGDPYTQYFTPEEYKLFTSSMEDAVLVGVGGTFSLTEGGLLTERVFEGSAADKGGLQVGDIVTHADGKPLSGLTLDEAGQLLRGEEGSSITLTYLREGKKHTVKLTRTAFLVPTVYSQLMDGHIGYLDCDTYGEDTLTHFVDDMTSFSGLATSWIVDLRDNPGGDYYASMGTVGCFAGEDALSYLLDNQGEYFAYRAAVESKTMYPALVLTNENSASAAELFASSIRDTGTGIVLGERTYGKGVAQSVLDQTTLPDYFPDGDAIKITSYRFYSPGGTTNDTVGVIPHLLLDDDLADEAALLLSSPAPAGDTTGYLRVDLEWRWYIDLDQALSPEYQEAFVALLEALPDQVKVWQGTGGADGWTQTSAAALAEAHGLTDYTRRGFTDSADSPYRASIDLLATYGILQGTGDGTFQPETPLTRAQLCALLAQALNCKMPSGESQFADVDMNTWYGPAVNALASMGLVNGVGGGRFDPDAPVSHEQFVTIMGRLAQRLSMVMDLAWQNRPDTAGDSFVGWSDWAAEEAWLLAEGQTGLLGNSINLLWDLPQDIDPDAVTTREEAAALTCTLLQWVGILPELS